VDARTDVYALGCLLYEALTGQVPFPRARDVDKLMAHIAEPPPRPSAVAPGVPGDFDAVIARAMAKSPPERFTTAGELARAASAAAEQAGPPPTESSLLLRPDSHVPVDRDAPTAG
jgi:serine/threonine-protein kinase